MSFLIEMARRHASTLGPSPAAEAIEALLREHEAMQHVTERVEYDPLRREIPPGEPPSVGEVEELASRWASEGAAPPAAPFLVELHPTPLATGLAVGFVVSYLTVVGGVVMEGETPVSRMARVVKSWRPIGPLGPLAYRYAPRIAADLPRERDLGDGDERDDDTDGAS